MRSKRSRSASSTVSRVRLRQVAEEQRELARALEHVLAVAAPLGLAGLEREMRADGDERVLQRAAPPVVHVHVVAGADAQPEGARALDQPAVAGAVAAPQGPLQLDAQTAPAERLGERAPACERHALVGVHERAVARAAREADEALGARAECGERRAWHQAVACVRGGEQLREVLRTRCASPRAA